MHVAGFDWTKRRDALTPFLELPLNMELLFQIFRFLRPEQM